MVASKGKAQEDSAYKLYILRHGIAAPRGSGGSLDDSKRKLTPEGRERMQEVAKGLKRLGLALDWIVTSPLARALETAQIVSEGLGSKAPLDPCDELRPGEPPEKLLAYLAKQPERKQVLLVGHEPDLSKLAARLLGAGRDVNLALKKGGCCLISSEQFPLKSEGQLVWWLTPRLLRAIK
jgi:phosphohistidine phosphatase